jgi:hypothetical protein
LFKLRDNLSLITFENLTNDKELDLLEDEELVSIKEFFNKELDLFKFSINTKIQGLQLQKDNEKLSDKLEEQAEQIVVPLPSPPSSQIANMDVFEVMTNQSQTPYGSGATQNVIPLIKDPYPSNSNEVDFLDLVIEELNTCKNNIEYIRKRFAEDNNITKSEQDLKNIEKVRGAKFLLEKTALYILDQLPQKP